MTDPGDHKVTELREWLRRQKSVLIAFSGGVDSTFLLTVAHAELGRKAVAATAVSPVYSAHERTEAEGLAAAIGVRHIIFDSNELDVPQFRSNPPERCYLCKLELFTELQQMAKREKLAVVCDGSNADDLKDYRPGRRAGDELGISSPLAKIGFSKSEIRTASRALGIPTYNKPAFACLASRFPYGETISEERLQQVEKSESILRERGFSQFRVRHHGTIARIEVPQQDLQRVLSQAKYITAGMRDCGFSYVTLDLEGYRTGSMNETLGTKSDAAACQCCTSACQA